MSLKRGNYWVVRQATVRELMGADELLMGTGASRRVGLLAVACGFGTCCSRWFWLPAVAGGPPAAAGGQMVYQVLKHRRRRHPAAQQE